MMEPKVPIAKEGYPFICLAAFISVIFALLGYDLLTIISSCFTIFTVYFFRDPERISPADTSALISPADGNIILIEKEIDNQYVNDDAYKISIFMNVFDVHVNRSPVDGMVTEVNHMPGKFYSANTAMADLENEKCAMVLKTETDLKIGVVQVAGLIARRIVSWVRPNDKLLKGGRFGMIRFGSRVDLYIPQSIDLEVAVGQKVRAGETIIGHFADS